MNLGEFRTATEFLSDEVIITCSPGGGILRAITPTVNGVVILDAEPAARDEKFPGVAGDRCLNCNRPMHSHGPRCAPPGGAS